MISGLEPSADAPAVDPDRAHSRVHGRLRRRLNGAEAVADVLRGRILSGEVAANALLPTQDELVAEFGESKAAIREACRILETEGLLNIRRGNVGGASVHPPTPLNVAYGLSLVLDSRNVVLADVRDTLAELEPVCASLCAGRPDRAATVVAQLEAANDRLRQCLIHGDGTGAAGAARDWHEIVAAGCGLETMSVMVGSLEDIWSAHVRADLPATRALGSLPDPSTSRSVIDDHERITRMIAAGDRDGAAAAAAAHLRGEPRIHAESRDVCALDVSAAVVRDQLFSR